MSAIGTQHRLQLVADYLGVRVSAGEFSGGTVTKVRLDLRSFVDFIADIELTAVTAQVVGAWAWRGGAAVLTARSRIMALSGWSRWLAGQGIAPDFCADVAIPTKAQANAAGLQRARTGGRVARRRSLPWRPGERSTGDLALVDEYVAERVGRGEFSGQSAEVVWRILSRFIREVSVPINEVTPAHVAAWLGSRVIEPNTVRSRLNTLRPWARWMVERGHLSRDFCSGLRPPRASRGLPRCLPTGEVSALRDHCGDPRADLAVVLMAQLGLRIGEVVAIRHEDIDTVQRVLQVRGKGGRGDVTRAVAIPAQAWTRIETHTRGALRRGYPLVGHTTEPARAVTANYLGRLIREVMRSSGIKTAPYDGVSPHALRHTAAQHVADSGADVRHVMVMLGHRSLATTTDYLRRKPPGLAEAMEGRTY